MENDVCFRLCVQKIKMMDYALGCVHFELQFGILRRICRLHVAYCKTDKQCKMHQISIKSDTSVIYLKNRLIFNPDLINFIILYFMLIYNEGKMTICLIIRYQYD